MSTEVPVSGSNESSHVNQHSSVSDEMLRDIAEQGFFLTQGSLAIARAACSELRFARAMIEAQTTRISQLGGGVR